LSCELSSRNPKKKKRRARRTHSESFSHGDRSVSGRHDGLDGRVRSAAAIELEEEEESTEWYKSVRDLEASWTL